MRRSGPAILLLILFLAPYLGIDFFGRAIQPIRALMSSLIFGDQA